MSALDDLATEVYTNLSGFGLMTPRSAWLKTSVDDADLEFELDGPADKAGEGIAEIGSELVYVRSLDPATNRLKIAPDGRGWDGSEASSHAAQSRITFEPPFPKVSVKRAINTAIERSYPTLVGVDSIEFDFNPSVMSYEMPTDAVGILGVTHEVFGTSEAWPEIHHYSFDSDANTAAFPSGKSITLERSAPVGRTVRVLYSKRPAALTASSTHLSDSGLAPSAKYAIVLGACSHLLRFTDAARLAPLAASSDEYDSKRPYLTGVKLANDFEIQFQAELMAEARRFRQSYPARIVRKRL